MFRPQGSCGHHHGAEFGNQLSESDVAADGEVAAQLDAQREDLADLELDQVAR